MSPDNCTARLPTHTVTDEVVAFANDHDMGVPWKEVIYDGVTVKREGDRLVRVEVHELGCDRDHSLPGWKDFHGKYREGREDIYDETWTDQTPGAIPHADSEPDVTVSDAEIEAARDAIGEGWSRPGYEAMKHALLAAKRAEKEQP